MSLKIGDGSGDTLRPAASQFVAGIDPQDCYGAEWARHIQAWLFDVDERCRKRAESLFLLTATASTVWPGEDTTLIPPAVHFERGLRASRDARHKALNRALREYQYQTIRVYGVGAEGHLHRHNVVCVGSDIDPSTLRPWISAHTNNSPLADEAAHGDGAIRTETDITADRDDISSLIAYAMLNVPGCDTRERDHGIQSAPTNVQRGATVLDRVGAEPVTVGPVSPASE